jgi:putative intracellular protease/amidase
MIQEIRQSSFLENSILFYVQNGFTDLEYSYIVPVLQQACCKVVVVSEDGRAVKSREGLRIQPDKKIADVEYLETRGIILPGGDAWLNTAKNEKVLDLAEKYLQEGKMVAAICRATVGLARRGLLDNRTHTSNDLQALRLAAPQYRGEKNYHWRLTVGDENLITSAGVGALEFTEQVMNFLKIDAYDYRKQWYHLYTKNSKPIKNIWKQTS